MISTDTEDDLNTIKNYYRIAQNKQVKKVLAFC